MQSKAGFFKSSWVLFFVSWGQKMGSVLRPDSGHRNGTALEVLIRKQRKTDLAGPFRCPESGRKMCAIFRPQNPHNQAQAVWQWYNCCAARVPAGKAPLRINMDETSVCLFQGGGKGTVVFKRRRDPGVGLCVCISVSARLCLVYLERQSVCIHPRLFRGNKQ
jgi:hypothetical protein